MLPRLARLALLAVLGPATAPPLAAQDWNDPRSRDLVSRATRRRMEQLADSGLSSYSATARGFVTFLAQLGEGFLLPPKVVKADQLALEIHWAAPNHSRQWIVGRRDTLLLPTDIQYHRDHLGIVQNNFPDIIRLGDGDEVRDVPHPLSRTGLVTYDFAIADSLRIEIPGRTIDVYEVKVRPRDERAAAAVGALYIARDDAQVVRMAFSFTRAALRDEQLEDVSVILENALIEDRFWLPRRQEIEIRRTGSWMDFPVKGIIRGRWDIRDYAVNRGDAAIARAAGPEIAWAPAARRAAHRWEESAILDLLPVDVRVATDDDVREVQEEARRLVRQQALARGRRTLPSARGVSDLVHVNRAEGLALGGALRRRLGLGWDLGVGVRWGLSDREAKGALSIGWERADGLAWRIRGFRDYRDAGDEPEMSRVASSISAQEFGSDYSDPFEVRGVGLGIDLPPIRGVNLRFDAGFESHRAATVEARPSWGRHEPTLPVEPASGPRARLTFDRTAAATGSGMQVRLKGSLQGGRLKSERPAGGVAATFVRAYGVVEVSSPPLDRAAFIRIAAGGVRGSGAIPVEERLFAGGPVTAPGYRFHQLQGSTMGSLRVERRFGVPFVPVPLGRWGRVPGAATLSPYLGGVFRNRTGGGAWHPYAGAGLVVLFDLVRVDVARGLRDGRWRVTADLTRDFWSIL